MDNSWLIRVATQANRKLNKMIRFPKRQEFNFVKF